MEELHASTASQTVIQNKKIACFTFPLSALTIFVPIPYDDLQNALHMSTVYSPAFCENNITCEVAPTSVVGWSETFNVSLGE